MKSNHIHLANILTFSRIILGVVFLLLFFIVKINKLSYTHILIIESISILIFITAIITDGLDGYFARKKNKVTDFGKHFDPLSDSIFFMIVFFTFLYIGLMPWYFFILILAREVFMHLYLRPYCKKKGTYLPANKFGKIKTVLQFTFSLTILTFLIFTQILHILSVETKVIDYFNLGISTGAYIFFAVIAFFSLFSLFIYLKNTFKPNLK